MSSRPAYRWVWLWALLLVAVIILCGLGVWQVERLAWKEALIARVDARLKATPVPAPAPEAWSRLDRDEFEYTPVKLAGTFDLIFIDADKPNNSNYLQWALKLAHAGTVVILDNVIRDGRVIDADSGDANVKGAREAFQLLQSDPRIDATALQTVGLKGWDGFAIGVVR